MSNKEKDVVASLLEATAGQKAMVKLLVRLRLLSEDQLSKRLIFLDYEPLEHYALLGSFKSWDAILKVADSLKIQAHRIEKIDVENATRILSDPLISKIPSVSWKKYRAVPIGMWDNELLVAMANPLDVETIKRLEFELQKIIRVVISEEKEILTLLSDPTSISDGLDFGSLLKTSNAPKLSHSRSDVADLDSHSAQEDIAMPAVIRLVNKIFSGAIQKSASDVHISPENGKLTVRLRIDGIMRNSMDIPDAYKEAVVARIKVLCGMDVTERRKPQDGRLRVKTALGQRDLRISTVPTVYGENLVARILSSEIQKLDLASVGMPVVILHNLEKALSQSSKVNLVAGPTGSGKTSTLYASLMRLRDGSSNIITIEDPIEYRISGVNQIQVNQKIDMTFAKVLRSVLRQDPDIIMVGEIRDAETAATVMQVAQTGHLVLSTIHTNTAAGAITRLRDLAVPPFLIASSLGAVLAQRLVRMLCKNCSVPLHGPELERVEAQGVATDGLLQATGCEACDGSGYQGRMGVFSFIEVNSAVAAAIREEKGEQDIENVGRSKGFETLEEAALRLAYQGVTSIEEIERVLGRFDLKSAQKYINGEPSSESVTVFDEAPVKVTEENSIIPKRKILVVDDDKNIREIYQMILEYEMFEVSEAEDGAEALKKIYESPPELVLLDLMMPKMNGMQLIEKLKADPRTKNIPVLVLTAAATDENELQLIKQGANDFVSKTARSEIIVARINRLLNR